MDPKKRSNPKSKRRFDAKANDKAQFKGRSMNEDGRSRINDPEWYVSEPQLVKDVGSLSFNNALGGEYSINPDSAGTDFNPGSTRISASIPGIMSIFTGPAVNPANGPYSALNLATKDLFKRVRRMNAGSTNYDSPDLMLYILAMDSIYSAIFFMQRILGCANVYSQVNRYVGDAFIKAQGIDPYYVRSNLATYRARLNMLITKVSAFATPRDINLFKRHAWMYQGMYMDEPVKKAQVYMYVPAFIWRYVEDSGGPGYLKPEYISTVYTTAGGTFLRMLVRDGLANKPLLTVDQLFHTVESCLQAIIESQDMNIMSGDILKAYGDEGIWKMSLVDENYATIPVFSDEVLDQIHNTNFVGVYPSKSVSLDEAPMYSDESLRLVQVVSEGGNYLWYTPKFVNCEHNSFEKLLDLCDDNPTPERVIVGSRNMVSGSSALFTATGVNNTYLTNINTCGSDMAFIGAYYTLDNGELVCETFGYSSRFGVGNNIKFSRFHKAPIMYQTATNGRLTSITGEVGNFTIVNCDTLQKLHETAMLSLLGVSM